MQFIKRKLENSYLLILLLLLSVSIVAGADYQLESWLQTGALKLNKPVFSTETDIRGNSWSGKDALKFEQLDIKELEPKPGMEINWPGIGTKKWDIAMAGSEGELRPGFSDSDNPEIVYLVTYLETDRWLKGEIKLDCQLPLKLWLDGKEVLTKSKINNSDETTADIKMTRGVHRIALKLVKPEGASEADLKARLKINDKYKTTIKSYVEPFGYMDIEHLLYIPKVEKASISASGDLFAVLKRHVLSSEKTEKWVEIRNYSDGSLVHTFRGGMEMQDFKWAPKGNIFSYTTEDEDYSTIWKYDIETGESEKILEKVKNLDDYQWTKDSKNIIYSMKVEHPQEEIGVRRLRGLEDRQKVNRYDHYLYRVNVKSGFKQRLTAGKLSTRINALSPDGNRLIFSRHHIDYDQRPFSYDVHYLLNLNDLSVDSLFTSRWLTSMKWSPQGDKLLVTGGPSMFNGAGVNLPENIIPNESDAQAYIYSLDNVKVKPISRDFAPSIVKGQWIQEDRMIFLVEDRAHVSLYEYDVSKNTFMNIDSYIEAIDNFDFAHNNSNNGIYYGTSANEPTQINKLKFGWRGKNKMLLNPAEKYYKNVELSKVKRWTFNNKDGIEIEGRVYYPPDFKRDRKYPCIVYYYGGTSPVSRNFDGRYPKNYWAAKGYIVYVMQPSGATGFGQEFSAKHVNEWGTIVPDEIINGVKKFVDAHPFVNKDRLGCIGASYGGFTTEILVTKTDMFAAAVSHAGISSIPGYWGEGYWGYWYGARANVNRFPWKNTDFFIDNSAYFDADKITTPLLMTHGTDDMNVPTGQSIQLYTALKILGKEVELLECADQAHWVLDPAQREKWSKSIVAWFDKWLKDQPEWWNDLYSVTKKESK